jgi:hypothetical protein
LSVTLASVILALPPPLVYAVVPELGEKEIVDFRIEREVLAAHAEARAQDLKLLVAGLVRSDGIEYSVLAAEGSTVGQFCAAGRRVLRLDEAPDLGRGRGLRGFGALQNEPVGSLCHRAGAQGDKTTEDKPLRGVMVFHGRSPPSKR